jgi:argininosuccinate synthase
MNQENKKVVLAYSGGLDTTYCAIYLKKIKGLEVHALTVNTGGFSSQEMQSIEKRARALGVASFQSVDVTEDYYHSCIRYLIFGKNGCGLCGPRKHRRRKRPGAF